MFFSLTPGPKQNFPCQRKLGRINFFSDQGWSESRLDQFRIIYKGYADDFDLSGGLVDIVSQSQPTFSGNFCVICHDLNSGEISIKNDRWRGFPIYLHQDEITNLVPGSRVAWTDSMISCDQTFAVQEEKFDAIGAIETAPISGDQAVIEIGRILRDKTQKFLRHNHRPIIAHLSGGVDSLLVYALLHDQGADMQLIKCSHFDYDPFWLMNDTQILANFWGYGQLHHWQQPCVLTSGAPGDEFMLRSPTTLDQLLKYHGLLAHEILKDRPGCLHRDYFSMEKNLRIFHEQTVDPHVPMDQFYWSLCNIVLNDWQHWHLGHTLTWTPLRDLDVFKTCLRLPTQQAIDQMFDSSLSIRLIELLCPGLSASISDQKNSANPMRNLVARLFDCAE